MTIADTGVAPGGDLHRYYVDPVRWPHTSSFLALHGKERDAYAKRAMTVGWAYGAALDKAERVLMAERALRG